jgi:hypothetical protein
MSEDFYTASARQRLERINAETAACQADLAAHKANGDYDSAGQTIQQLANLAAEQDNLSRLYNNYVQSQQPRQPRELTDQERLAKPVHRMDYGDVWQMANTGKYGVDEAKFRAGMAEVQRRKARGE